MDRVDETPLPVRLARFGRVAGRAVAAVVLALVVLIAAFVIYSSFHQHRHGGYNQHQQGFAPRVLVVATDGRVPPHRGERVEPAPGSPKWGT